MKIFINFLILFYYSAQASVIVPKEVKSDKDSELQEILSNTFYEQLYERLKNIPKVETKAPVKTSVNHGERGKILIEKMKQRNRERLALMRGHDPENVKTGKDLVELQRQDNKDVLMKMAQAQKQYEKKYNDLTPDEQRATQTEIEAIRLKVLKEHRDWRKTHQKTLEEWEKEKGRYLKNIDEYQKGLAEIPLILPVSKQEKEKKVEIKIDKEFFFVPGTFEVSIRDQKQRPTCSSFAGLRAVEILLAQNGNPVDLSEQYFYWASKPDCHTKKCAKGGSWVGNGLEFSKKSNDLDIPLEKDCPYKTTSIAGNDTQIPLNNECRKGHTKVEEFNYHTTLDDMVETLKRNRPVMASFRLTPNFYSNTGLILASESNIGEQMDSHSLGHSVLIVGHMKLPKILDEGSLCFVVANSWGVGWGHGGYSCISEKWFLKNRSDNPFVSVSRARI